MDQDDDELDNPFDDNDSGNEGEAADSRNSENAAGNNTAVTVPVPKRVVKNPRLKFNADRLCGDRGIPVLVNHFKDVKFKGKGHEKEDLNKLLATLEHWTHRLFPSMKFIDCLRHIEKLGKKRPVQTCLNKIRMDMPILNNDFIHGDDDDDEREDPKHDGDIQEIDPFDSLLTNSQKENFIEPNVSTPSSHQNVGHVLGTSFGSSLTEEQRKRMEHNKMLAAERRKASLSALQGSSLNSSIDDATSPALSKIIQSDQNTSEEDNGTKSLNLSIASCSFSSLNTCQKPFDDDTPSDLGNHTSIKSTDTHANKSFADVSHNKVNDSENLQFNEVMGGITESNVENSVDLETKLLHEASNLFQSFSRTAEEVGEPSNYNTESVNVSGSDKSALKENAFLYNKECDTNMDSESASILQEQSVAEPFSNCREKVLEVNSFVYSMDADFIEENKNKQSDEMMNSNAELDSQNSTDKWTTSDKSQLVASTSDKSQLVANDEKSEDLDMDELMDFINE